MNSPVTQISLEHSQELMDKTQAALQALRTLAEADQRIVHTVSQNPRLTKALEELELYQGRTRGRHARLEILGR